jgi:hypothetical protein
MPIIINDFEVAAEPPPSAPAASAGSGGQAAAPAAATEAPKPLDLLRVEEHRARRNLRLWAH